MSFVKIPHEFKPVEGLIATSLGSVYTVDSKNRFIRDLRFCIELDLSLGWTSGVEVVGILRKQNIVLLNYDPKPIWCRFGLSLNHRVADCLDLKFNNSCVIRLREL